MLTLLRIALGIQLVIVGTLSYASAADHQASGDPSRPRTDHYRNSLPKGAVVLLGRARFIHGSFLESVTFSPDGRFIASHSRDGTNRLWDAATGAEIAPTTQSKEAPLAAGGKLLIMDRQAKGIRLRDLASNQVVCKLPLDWPDGIFLLSPDAKSLVAYRREVELGKAKTVLVFAELAGRKASIQVTLPEGRELAHFAFSTDGRTLALSYHHDQRIHIWDPATRSEQRAFEILAPNTTGHQWALSPDGRCLATASPIQGDPILLWDLNTGRKLKSLPNHAGEVINSLDFSPDGGKLVSVHAPNLVRLWDLSIHKETHCIQGWAPIVIQAVFSPDSKRLALVDGDRVRLCDAITGDDCFSYRGHRREIRIVAFSSDGKNVATGSYNENDIYLWNARTGALERQLIGHRSGITGLAYSPDGKQIASSSYDGQIYLWDPITGRQLRLLAEFRHSVFGVAFSPDGKMLASAEERSPAIRIWNVTTGRQLNALDGPSPPVLKVAFSPDGKTLAEVNSSGNGVRLWNVATGARFRQFSATQTYNLGFATDGRSLAAGRDDGTVHLWDVTTGQEVRRLESRDRSGRPNNRCFAIAIAPDGFSLAVGYEDRTIRLWETASGKERLRLNGHRGEVLALAFASDGRHLASGSEDRTAIIWDITANLGNPAELTRGDLERLWEDLHNTDAAKAYRAICILVSTPSQTVPWLRDHLHSVAHLTPELRQRIAGWVADLDSEQFAARERAQQELEQLGDVVEPVLRQTLIGKPSVEAQRRIRDLLTKLKENTPDHLQALRALEILEHIGTEEAKRLLSTVAEGATDARLTRAAMTVLQCLHRSSNAP